MSLRLKHPTGPGGKRLAVQPQLQMKFQKPVATVCPLQESRYISIHHVPFLTSAASASASPADNQCRLFCWNGVKYGWFNRNLLRHASTNLTVKTRI